MAGDGGKESVTHEAEVILVGQHVGREVAALRKRLHRVHLRYLYAIMEKLLAFTSPCKYFYRVQIHHC